jgi:dTDP-4-amino-4,6-dideoxygalactose transaminase
LIPLQKPLLPSAKKLLPYLEKIDKSRWYSNTGPLVREYEERISEHFNCYAVSCSSGTMGLAACIMNKRWEERIKIPSWTFCATANAVRLAGYIPYLVDRHEPQDITVSEFGSLPPYGKITDAAGAFDTVKKFGDDPVVISTHATKAFSTGEGGLVLSKYEGFIEKVRETLNHGFDNGKDVPKRGLNGKLSEYHAAVGLASLDEWEITREKWIEARHRYLKILGMIGYNMFASSLFYLKTEKSVVPIIKHLKEKGIQSRQVWGTGLHNYRAYKDLPRSSNMEMTERMADTHLFLPFRLDMPDDEMEYVGKVLADLS